MKYILDKKPLCSFAIIVPSITLQKQWTELLIKANIPKFKVTVINSIVIKGITVDEDCTFIDEYHTMINGNVFGKLYSLINSKAIIAFSGTFKPEHETVMNSYFPCADKITIEEGRKNNWVSEIQEYNLYIPLSKERQEEYNRNHEMCEEYFAFFNQDFTTAMGCISSYGAVKFIRDNRIQIRDTNGLFLDNATLMKLVSRKSNIWRDCLQKRTTFINSSPEKVLATAQIVNSLNKKTITFGLITETADKLTELIPKSVSYHSNLHSKMMDNSILSKYQLSKKDSGKTKVGSSRLKQLALLQLEDNSISTVNSAKALDLGLDIAGMDCAIIYCRNSGKEKNLQRGARVTRKEGDKVATIINVILKDTKDESWAKSAQYGRKFIKNVYSVDELLDDLNQNTK